MSYRGRHRADPGPLPGARAAVVAAVAVGAPLALASPASAAVSADWGAIAMCESGGQNIRTRINPQVNTASGYFQIINGTWRGAGGREFAPTAMQASMREQLIVAKRIANARGSLADWNESRSCWANARKGRMALTGAGDAPRETPRVETPRRADTPRVETPRRSTPQRSTAARGLPQVPDGYVIKRGDTLAKLAKRWDVPGGYRALAAANGIDNPNRIFAGDRLR